MALHTSLMASFCEVIQYVTADGEMQLGWYSAFGRFHKGMNSSLDSVDIGNTCQLCRQAVDERIKAIKSAFPEDEETRKRKRELADEGRRTENTAAAA